MKTKFILDEERQILETVVGLKVPFCVEQVEVDNATVTTFIFTRYNSLKELKFVTVARNGQVNYDFDESVLHQVENWMQDKTVSNIFKNYLEYKAC